MLIMDDSIEICAGCGKMPRMTDKMSGTFTCPRCGGSQTMLVTTEKYEETALALDQKFHKGMMVKNIQEASKEPIKMNVKSKAKISSAKKSSPKKSPAKKTSKKKK